MLKQHVPSPEDLVRHALRGHSLGWHIWKNSRVALPYPKNAHQSARVYATLLLFSAALKHARSLAFSALAIRAASAGLRLHWMAKAKVPNTLCCTRGRRGAQDAEFMPLQGVYQEKLCWCSICSATADAVQRSWTFT